MQVDEESSDESSDEEVRPTLCAKLPEYPHAAHRKRSSTPQALWNCWRHGGSWRNILFPGWISATDRWTTMNRCLLHSLPCFLFPCRAQKRVAQQRIDSKMPLGRIIDIRKKVFAEVKVSYSICKYLRPLTLFIIVEPRKFGFANRRRTTSVISPVFPQQQVSAHRELGGERQVVERPRLYAGSDISRFVSLR